MPQDASQPISKAVPWVDNSSPAVAWQVEMMKPSRQRNMTRLQRLVLARTLRQLRRERYQATQAGS